MKKSFIFFGLLSSIFFLSALIPNDVSASALDNCRNACFETSDPEGCYFAQCASLEGGGSSFALNCSNITNLGGVAGCAVSLMNIIVYFLIAFAFIYTLYGALRFIGAEGEDRKHWRNVMTYGILALFIMVSIWGIVNLLTGTFGLDNTPLTVPDFDVNLDVNP